MRRVGWLAVVMAVGAVVTVPTTAAHASCAARPSPRGQPVIFVGTAVEQRRGYTRFDVLGVRAGPDLAPEVWVRSGQEQPPWPLSLFLAVGSSADAEFVEGESYIVGARRSFATGLCTVAAAGERAGDLQPPVADGSRGADPPIGPVAQTLWTVAVVGLLAAGIVLLGRRSRSRRGS